MLINSTWALSSPLNSQTSPPHQVCAQSLSRFGLCDPMAYRPPGLSVYGILQARILEWGAISQIQALLTFKWTYPSISRSVPIRDSTDTPQTPQLFQNQTQCCLYTHTRPCSYVSHWRSESHNLPPTQSPVVLNPFPFP